VPCLDEAKTVRFMVQKPEITFEPRVPFILVLYAIDAGRLMQESVALDTSHESSRGTTRLPSPEVSADNEEFSDWDSWEGENEVQVFILNCKLDGKLVISLDLCLTLI